MRPEAVDRYDAEALRLSRLLALAVKQKEVSVRSLEKKMRVGDSVFSKVLKGRVGLQVRHVLMIADAIGLDWKEFFAVAYGLQVPATGKAEAPAASPEDILAEKVIQALARRLLAPAPEPPKSGTPPVSR